MTTELHFQSLRTVGSSLQVNSNDLLAELSATEDGKAAVDEALKELGVKSVGHRLKIFAALQE